MVIAQEDKSIGKEIPLVEIQRGHRLMRFATAAVLLLTGVVKGDTLPQDVADAFG